MTRYIVGQTYNFIHYHTGKIFRGVLIERNCNLDLAFSGEIIGEGKEFHLPLTDILDKNSNWVGL